MFRIAPIGLLLAAIGLNTAPAFIGAASIAQAQEQAVTAVTAVTVVTLRPEVGKPLQAAQDLLKAKKYKEALAKVNEADSVAGITPNERLTIDRMRATVAYAAGDRETATKAFEAVLASGRVAAPDMLKIIQALSSMHYQARDYPKAIVWINRYLKEGGEEPSMRPLLIQSYYLNNEFARAAAELQSDIQAAEKAGRTPTEDQLQLLVNCALKQNDKAGYANAMEKLVTYHPKKDYWIDLLNRVQSKPGFSDRLLLDVYRLKFSAGLLTRSADYMEMSQLALQAGFPAEAVKIVEQGFTSGALGTGAEAARHKRLRDLASKNAAEDGKTMAQGEAEAAKSKDGIGLVNLGYAYVTAGQFEKGIGLMERGISKGSMKRPEDAKLHMGIAYLQAGHKDKALQTLKSVRGSDGTADIARYWVMLANRPLKNG